MFDFLCVYFLKFIFIGVELPYNVVLVSTAEVFTAK